MNMIHKVYDCTVPASREGWSSYVKEYKISAWQAMGSKTVNYTMSDGAGWMSMVFTEVLGKGANLGIRTMDDLIDYLYWVVKA